MKKKIALPSKMIKSRKVLSKTKPTVIIKERKPAEYVNGFFKNEMEEAKDALFFR